MSKKWRRGNESPVGSYHLFYLMYFFLLMVFIFSLFYIIYLFISIDRRVCICVCALCACMFRSSGGVEARASGALSDHVYIYYFRSLSYDCIFGQSVVDAVRYTAAFLGRAFILYFSLLWYFVRLPPHQSVWSINQQSNLLVKTCWSPPVQRRPSFHKHFFSFDVISRSQLISWASGPPEKEDTRRRCRPPSSSLVSSSLSLSLFYTAVILSIRIFHWLLSSLCVCVSGYCRDRRICSSRRLIGDKRIGYGLSP